MNKKLISNGELEELKDRINAEIKRRSTFSWWDPLSTPTIGENKTPPLNIPDKNVVVDDETYTINTPSEGSIERTRNINKPIHGDNPGGNNPPNSSAGRWDVDEVRNYLAGLSKINDINLYYGRDEKPGTSFRDPSGIEDLLSRAENDKLHNTVPFLLNLRLSNGDLIVDYSGVTDPDMYIDENGDLIINSEVGDEYDAVSTLRFHIDSNGDLILDDIEHIIYMKEDPNHGKRNEYDPNRGGVVEDILTTQFVINKPDLYMKYTFNINEEFPLKVTIENGDLIIRHPADIDVDFNIEDGELKFTYDTGYTEKFYIPFDAVDGYYAMPSGEYDGEELTEGEPLGPNNFFDDYGAPEGDGHYHTYNVAITPTVRRTTVVQNDQREEVITVDEYGGVPTANYGQTPRNPYVGDTYKSRLIYEGVPGTCNNACTGLCSVSCDDLCSESCTSTCFARCGNACTSTCGNACTGCSTLCYNTCRTKCENSSGYACVNAGAKTVKITTRGGKNGVPASNNIEYTTYSCNGCSYSCQFYPNKKTECWDAACMSKCFTSCNTACSESCSGGCIDNVSENESYKVGKGRGCSAGCTINCIGSCQGVCEGQCTQTCWHACKQLCLDNCTWVCSTNCGSGCANTCVNSTTSKSGCRNNCTSMCENNCNGNCIGIGCRSICGTESSGACDFNCRINCSSGSCSSLCGEQCSSQCTTCVNTCDWACGACSSMCSTGCESACNILCTTACKNSCELNCVRSCSETCGGCSSLCFSCTGMCIGVCSIKCENGCSSCSGMCSWWCDTSCSRECFVSCETMCMFTCSTSCVTYATSDSTNTEGPEIEPTSEGYVNPHPSNRLEEQESFRNRKE